MERMPQNGCDVIQAEVDTDVEIAKAAINLSTFRPTTLIEKAQTLLFSTTQRFSTVMHSFRSDKVKSYVYNNITGPQQVLGEKVCNDVLFPHALMDVTRCPWYSGLENKLESRNKRH